MSLSIEPPLVLVALGPNATVRPYLSEGAEFGISILAADQRRVASVFADPFPVGPDPFEVNGVPLIRGALVQLECTVTEVRLSGAHAVLTAAVAAGAIRAGTPLLRFDRAYHTLNG